MKKWKPFPHDTVPCAQENGYVRGDGMPLPRMPRRITHAPHVCVVRKYRFLMFFSYMRIRGISSVTLCKTSYKNSILKGSIHRKIHSQTWRFNGNTIYRSIKKYVLFFFGYIFGYHE